MTAWHTLGLCTAMAVSALLLCGAGATLLRLLKATKVSAFDTFLFSAATGTILLQQLFLELLELGRTERLLAALFVLVLTLQGLASLAPLTGSDALHYHFTM